MTRGEVGLLVLLLAVYRPRYQRAVDGIQFKFGCNADRPIYACPLLTQKLSGRRISFAVVEPAFLVIHEQITSTPSSTPYISDCFLANLVLARSW
jgi:hypothetical protein